MIQDQHQFASRIEPYRGELLAHCLSVFSDPEVFAAFGLASVLGEGAQS